MWKGMQRWLMEKLRWKTRSTCPRTSAWRNLWLPWDQVEQTWQNIYLLKLSNKTCWLWLHLRFVPVLSKTGPNARTGHQRTVFFKSRASKLPCFPQIILNRRSQIESLKRYERNSKKMKENFDKKSSIFFSKFQFLAFSVSANSRNCRAFLALESMSQRLGTQHDTRPLA